MSKKYIIIEEENMHFGAYIVRFSKMTTDLQKQQENGISRNVTVTSGKLGLRGHRLSNFSKCLKHW